MGALRCVVWRCMGLQRLKYRRGTKSGGLALSLVVVWAVQVEDLVGPGQGETVAALRPHPGRQK
eukprot:2597481-Pyramimonas_sp.AAC.1